MSSGSIMDLNDLNDSATVQQRQVVYLRVLTGIDGYILFTLGISNPHSLI
jgi:hypothetical protein